MFCRNGGQVCYHWQNMVANFAFMFCHWPTWLLWFANHGSQLCFHVLPLKWLPPNFGSKAFISANGSQLCFYVLPMVVNFTFMFNGSQLCFHVLPMVANLLSCFANGFQPNQLCFCKCSQLCFHVLPTAANFAFMLCQW